MSRKNLLRSSEKCCVSVYSVDEEKIEQLVEKKIEEMGEADDSRLGKLVEKKVDEKLNSFSSLDDSESISRRQFLKMSGVGLGTLALSSTAAGWFSVGSGSGGGGGGGVDTHGDSSHEYELQINGTTIGSSDTINFKT